MTGCALQPTLPPEAVFPPLPNPITVAARDPYLVWETVVDVIDDYFDLEYEEPVRVVENVVTEGRLETFPRPAATVFEPWRRDSVGRYERWYSTLQSVRRRAVVRVASTPQGYQVNVEVFKELEDVPPEQGGYPPASFRNDSSLARVSSPPGVVPTSGGWIPLGRDFLLEQRILNELAARLGTVPVASLQSVSPFHGRINAGPPGGGAVPPVLPPDLVPVQ